MRHYTGTAITKEFLASRMSSWQVHLQSISPYLAKGEGIWWSQTDLTYTFHDGQQHQHSHQQGPDLQYFWSTSRTQLDDMKTKHWQDILASKTMKLSVNGHFTEHMIT